MIWNLLQRNIYLCVFLFFKYIFLTYQDVKIRTDIYSKKNVRDQEGWQERRTQDG